ncbi:MAG: hypothetical protein WBM13_06595 [Bacteroidia bacterium]
MNIDIDKYLREHVTYSIEIMLSHEIYKEKYHQIKIDDNQILRGVFVGSVAKGRMLLEVIGIKLLTNGQINEAPALERDNLGEDSDKTPVHADNIRGKMADIISLNSRIPQDMEKVRHYLVAANKYELHLTKQRYDRDLKLYDQAIPVILKLIDEHIYLAHSENKKIRDELILSNRTFGDALTRTQ